MICQCFLKVQDEFNLSEDGATGVPKFLSEARLSGGGLESQPNLVRTES